MSKTVLIAEYESRVRRMIEQPNIVDDLRCILNDWLLVRSQMALLMQSAPDDSTQTSIMRKIDYCDYNIKLLLNL